MASIWKGWGVILAPKWHQVGQKIDSKINQKNDHLLDCLKIEFCWILAPKLVPKRRNRSLHFRSFLALGALLAPRPPQDLSKRPLGTDFERSWPPIWWILASNLVDFEWILTKKLLDFWLVGWVGWLVGCLIG